MTNSREKGKKGERQVCSIAKEEGYNAYRSQQFSGHKEKGDPDILGLPHIHSEVKWRQNINIQDALNQAKEDCSDGNIPVVFHRRNNEDWKVTMDIRDFFTIYREWEAGQALEGEHDD